MNQQTKPTCASVTPTWAQQTRHSATRHSALGLPSPAPNRSSFNRSIPLPPNSLRPHASVTATSLYIETAQSPHGLVLDLGQSVAAPTPYANDVIPLHSTNNKKRHLPNPRREFFSIPALQHLWPGEKAVCVKESFARFMFMPLYTVRVQKKAFAEVCLSLPPRNATQPRPGARLTD
jgi:hypothetical protein